MLKEGGCLRSDTWWKRGGEDGVVAAQGRRYRVEGGDRGIGVEEGDGGRVEGGDGGRVEGEDGGRVDGGDGGIGWREKTEVGWREKTR